MPQLRQFQDRFLPRKRSPVASQWEHCKTHEQGRSPLESTECEAVDLANETLTLATGSANRFLRKTE